MYNADLVRQLCGEIVKENDPEKAKDLISLLQAVIKDDQDEVRIRMALLVRRYAVVTNSKLADLTPLPTFRSNPAVPD